MAKTLFEMGQPESAGLLLNDAQRRAMTHGDGPLLVIAGAGTGKTRVITERIRHLLESDDSLLGENILALTYTKKAIAELRIRVAKGTGERGKDVVIANFHSFCEKILKKVNPGLVPLENVDHWILLRRNLARLKLEKYRRLAEPGQFLSDFIQFFSRCQDELVSSEDYQQFADLLAKELEEEKSALDEDTFKERAELVALQQEIARAYRASEEILREKHAVALNGLITEAVTLLKNDGAKHRQLQERFKHILVDEFQDTNIAQLELLHLLSGGRRNIVVVGDNDQAIYRFRGASFGSFKLFLQRFAGWKEGQDSSKLRVLLQENYRSTPNILRVATQAISHNETSADFPQKVLNASKNEGEKVRIVELAGQEEEARWVAGEIERIHRAGRRWRDFAVLYRAHTHRDALVRELSRRKVPFVISRLSILEHPLVKDLIAYLRLIAKPYDDIAAARVLAAPAWRVAPPELVRFAERARKNRKKIYDQLQTKQPSLPFEPSANELSELLDFLSAQRKTIHQRTAGEILTELLEWLEIYARASEQDRAYVKRLPEFVKVWDPKSATRGLPEFVEYLEYYDQAGGTISLEEDAPGDAAQLMTVHGAKGLEFSHVFVLRVNKNKFPQPERSHVFEFPARLMKEGAPEDHFHHQEERRLYYVALTRAQDRLTITSVAEKKGRVPPSLEDILMEPSIKRRDILRLAPKVSPVPADSSDEAGAEIVQNPLFAPSVGLPKVFSRIAKWAETFHPPSSEPLALHPSAVQSYRSCPQRYLFSSLWSLQEGPKATLTFGRVIHGTIRRIMAEFK